MGWEDADRLVNEGGAVVKTDSETIYTIEAVDNYDKERNTTYYCTNWSDALGRFLTGMHAFPEVKVTKSNNPLFVLQWTNYGSLE